MGTPHQLRLGIIGLGEVTQVMHLPSLAQLPREFRITALCDLSREVLDAVGDREGVKERFLDYRELIEHKEVDAVLVANPNHYHAPTTLAAIRAGKHVLIEKPMCVHLREADAIIEARKGTGIIVQVGTMRRYAPAFLEACRLVKEMESIRLARVHGLIGKNPLFTGNTSRVFRGSDLSQAVLAESNRVRDELMKEAPGADSPTLRMAFNLLRGLSSHDLSAMREMLGMPKRVLSATARQGGLYMSAVFDYGDFVCQFETGVDDIPRFDAHLEVYGGEQVIRVQYDTPYVRNLPIQLLVTEANGKGGLSRRSIHPSWGDPFVEEWKAFHAAVVDGRDSKCSPEDSRKDFELFDQMIAVMDH